MANFAPDNGPALRKGESWLKSGHSRSRIAPPSTCFRIKTFPRRIIVLDNRDVHINRENVEFESGLIPEALVLIEGHQRFNVALYMQATGRLNPEIDVREHGNICRHNSR